MTNAEIIAVVSAAERGEQIQARQHGLINWTDILHGDCVWNFPACDYRVKPPGPRSVFVTYHLGVRGEVFFHAGDARKTASAVAGMEVIEFREVIQ